MLPVHSHTPAQIIGELLTGHPEAASLQAEASHCQALASVSTARAEQARTTAQAVRPAFEELRHRLDPRRRHTVDFGAGLLILALLGAGLTLLDVIQLHGLLGGTSSVLVALLAAVVWLTGAWVAALAGREHHRHAVLAATVAALGLGLLLAASHGSSHRSMLFGALVSAFILALAAGAAVLMARMESVSLFLARRRWHRARAAYAAAARTEHQDVEMAAIAIQAWLGLVRSRAGTLADDRELVDETLALAVELVQGGHTQLAS